jgi:cyclopropane fatty-acyl-phospholipid synthase-like methyltransferase
MGVDVAELAIERARAKAEQRGISAMFEVGDVLHLDRLRRQFDVITDSGVFHVFDDEERPVYVNSLRSALRPGGMYYLMCFSDRQPGDWGPRRVSQAELRAAFVDGYAVQRKSYVPRAKSRVLRDLTQVDRRDGLPSPIVVNGLIEVWDRPGLGVDFKVEVAHEHLSEEDKHFFD